MMGTGSQDVSVQKDGCMYKGTIVHEYLHVLGFQHEQARPDRDNYLKVYYQNIEDGEFFKNELILLFVEINKTLK